MQHLQLGNFSISLAVRNIEASRDFYAKLHARDRSSAVQRARELRLLSAGLMR